MKLAALICVAFMMAPGVRAETPMPFDMPTEMKAVILDWLHEAHPAGSITSVAAVTDSSGMVTVCGLLSVQHEQMPFHMMIIPGETSGVLATVFGSTPDTSDKVRMMCSSSAIPLG